MEILFILIPVSLVVAGGFLGAFIWAVRSGQYDDPCTPSLRVLLDEPRAKPVLPVNPPVNPKSKP